MSHVHTNTHKEYPYDELIKKFHYLADGSDIFYNSGN